MSKKITRYSMANQSINAHLFQFYSFQGTLTKEMKTIHRTALPHSHDFYEIWFFKKGTGVHYINFQTFDITSPSIHFIAPDTIHLVKRNEDSTAYLLAFSQELFDLVFNNHQLLHTFPAYKQSNESPFIQLNATDFKSVCKLIEVIQIEQNSSNLFLNASLIHSLLSLTLPLFNKKTAPSSTNLLVDKFHRLVNLHFTKHYQIKQYAQLLALSPVILNRRLTKLTGVNASKHIQERMILEAKRLLVNSDSSVKEIAFQLGFKERSYFSQYFSKQVGLPPAQFRQKWFNNYNK